jgi:hypothetical protein
MENTDIYIDLSNYKEMTQLELSKKIPKWRKIYNDKNLAGSPYHRKLHLKKYCSACDDDEIFYHSTILDHTNHHRPFKSYNETFWSKYRLFSKNLILDAGAHYKAQKELNENALKTKMADHQKTDVICECGGHYSLRNKIKHFSTQKHVNFFCQESRK